MKTPYWNWHDLSFGWAEKQSSGGTFIYLVFSFRCAVCSKFYWWNPRKYHPECEALVERWAKEPAEEDDWPFSE